MEEADTQRDSKSSRVKLAKFQASTVPYLAHVNKNSDRRDASIPLARAAHCIPAQHIQTPLILPVLHAALHRHVKNEAGDDANDDAADAALDFVLHQERQRVEELQGEVEPVEEAGSDGRLEEGGSRWARRVGCPPA